MSACLTHPDVVEPAADRIEEFPHGVSTPEIGNVGRQDDRT